MANDNDHFADFVIAIAVMGLSLVVLVFLIKVLFHFIFFANPTFSLLPRSVCPGLLPLCPAVLVAISALHAEKRRF